MNNTMFDFFKLIVFTGDDFSNYELLSEKTHRLRIAMWDNDIASDLEIICTGYTTMGAKWAKDNHVGVTYLQEDTEMVEYADALLAFWDGESHEISHMIDCAKHMGIGLYVIRY